jgi:hypothetical protein
MDEGLFVRLKGSSTSKVYILCIILFCAFLHAGYGLGNPPETQNIEVYVRLREDLLHQVDIFDTRGTRSEDAGSI